MKIGTTQTPTASVKSVVSNLTMNKIFSIIVVITFSVTSCTKEKKFEDYNLDDFYEVQGVITYVHRTSNSFDSPNMKNIGFTYFLDRENPKSNVEKNLDMLEAQDGYPLIVLVHKDDENISFYGRVGILETLNEKEQVFLEKHFSNEIEELKGKVHNGLYEEIVKDTIQTEN